MLLRLCQDARQELILVAPFIKANTFRRLLTVTPTEVQVRCVTRWRLDEIAMGVSDLEVWLLLRDRPNASLWLRPDLHAKFYRADETTLVGSANLTDAALGWSKQPNLELLTRLPFQLEFQEFEQELFSALVRVDDPLYTLMEQSLEQFVLQRPVSVPSAETQDDDDTTEFESGSIVAWLPTLRHPEKLYTAYLGRFDELATASREMAQQDLRVLDVPKGLSREAFQVYVGAQLLQMPIIRQVDEFVVQPQRFGAVTNLLKRLPCRDNLEFSADNAWQTLMRWMMLFLPNRYISSVANYSEIFARKFGKHRI